MANIKDIVTSIFKKKKPDDASIPVDAQQQQQTWAKGLTQVSYGSSIAKKEGYTDATTNISPILSPQQIRYLNALDQLSLYDALIYIRQHSGKTEWKIYEDMMLDPTIDNAYQQRQSAVLKDDWDIVGDTVDDKVKQMVKEVLNLCENFNDALRAAHKAVLRGYSALEINWQQWGKYIIPIQINEKHPAWFNFNSIGNLTYSTVRTYPNYEPVQEEMSRKFIIHTHGQEAGDRRGKPILVRLYATWFMKKHATLQWATFISRYADPAWIAQVKNMFMKMPGDAKDRSIAEVISEVLNNARQGDDLVLPADSELKLDTIEPKSVTGSHELFLKFINELRYTILTTLIGQTDTAQTGEVGSYAKSQTSYQILGDRAETDRQEIETTLNRTLIPWICDYNGYANLEKYPEFRFNRPDVVDITSLKIIQSMGVPLKIKWLAEQVHASDGLPDDLPDDALAIAESGSNPFANMGAE